MMSSFAVRRGLSSRPPLVTIPCSESLRCKTSRQSSTSLNRLHCSNSPSLSAACSSGSKLYHSRPTNCRVLAKGQTLGAQPSLNAFLQHVCLSNWVRSRMDGIMCQLEKMESKLPDRDEFTLGRLLNRGGSGQDNESRLTKITPLLPPPEYMLKEDVKPKSVFHSEQRHSFQEIITDANKNVNTDCTRPKSGSQWTGEQTQFHEIIAAASKNVNFKPKSEMQPIPELYAFQKMFTDANESVYSYSIKPKSGLHPIKEHPSFQENLTDATKSINSYNTKLKSGFQSPKQHSFQEIITDAHKSVNTNYAKFKSEVQPTPEQPTCQEGITDAHTKVESDYKKSKSTLKPISEQHSFKQQPMTDTNKNTKSYSRSTSGFQTSSKQFRFKKPVADPNKSVRSFSTKASSGSQPSTGEKHRSEKSKVDALSSEKHRLEKAMANADKSPFSTESSSGFQPTTEKCRVEKALVDDDQSVSTYSTKPTSESHPASERHSFEQAMSLTMTHVDKTVSSHSAKPKSGLQPTAEQHSFEEAMRMADLDKSISTLYENQASPKRLKSEDRSLPKLSVQEKSPPPEKNWFQLMRLPFKKEPLKEPKEQAMVTAVDSKEAEEKATVRKESSIKDELQAQTSKAIEPGMPVEPSKLKEVTATTVQFILPYEYALKPLHNTATEKTEKLKVETENGKWNLFQRFLPFSSKQLPPEEERKAVQHAQVRTSAGPSEEENKGWGLFTRIPHPFRGSITTTSTGALAAQRKLLRSDAFVSRAEIEAKTQLLMSGIRMATNYSSRIDRLRELCTHVKQFPSCQYEAAVECKAVPTLLQLLQIGDQTLQEEALEALALLGYHPPVKGRGIRILCLDGGGTRAMVTITCLRKMEELSGRRIYELFDYVCGVSTGALLTSLVFLYRHPLDKVEQIYEEFGAQMFSRSKVAGAASTVWNQAFYDSDKYEEILKEVLGHKPMIEFVRDPLVPKVAAVSTLINTPRMKNFIFRNYNFPPRMYSLYSGSCNTRVWQAVRASSAAPGLFQDFNLDNYVHADGALMVNNPTALAIHESHLLWPQEQIQCVVSLGTGRYEPIDDLPGMPTRVTIKEKVAKMIDSASDNEEVHAMLATVMPADTYFRFNPYLPEKLSLDERRPDVLDATRRSTDMYLRKNQTKVDKAVHVLRQGRHAHQHAMDWVKLKADTRW